MAKMRGIKPEYYTSEQVLACSIFTRFMFPFIWQHCDDAGVIKSPVMTVRMGCFKPEDPVTLKDVEQMMEELLNTGLMEKYTINNIEYWRVTGWYHQNITRPVYRHPNTNGVIPKTKSRVNKTESERFKKYHEERFGRNCSCCEKREYVDIFSLKALSNGGKNNFENLVCLCRECQSGESVESIKKYSEIKIIEKDNLHNKKDCIPTNTPRDTVETHTEPSHDTAKTVPRQCRDTTNIEYGIQNIEHRIQNIEHGILNDSNGTSNHEQRIDSTLTNLNSNLEFSFLKSFPKKYHCDISTVIKYWADAMDYDFSKDGNDLGCERAQYICNKLSDGASIEECFEAIDGCKNNSWYMGKHPKNMSPRNDIKHIFAPHKFVEHRTFLRNIQKNGKTYNEKVANHFDEAFDKYRQMIDPDYCRTIDAQPENRISQN